MVRMLNIIFPVIVISTRDVVNFETNIVNKKAVGGILPNYNGSHHTMNDNVFSATVAWSKIVKI